MRQVLSWSRSASAATSQRGRSSPSEQYLLGMHNMCLLRRRRASEL
jgi:hypothetical protein